MATVFYKEVHQKFVDKTEKDRLASLDVSTILAHIKSNASDGWIQYEKMSPAQVAKLRDMGFQVHDNGLNMGIMKISWECKPL